MKRGIHAQPPPLLELPAVDHQTYMLHETVYEVLPAAKGGEPPYHYTLTGKVPGLTFDSDTRSLFGTPTKAGTVTLIYHVKDSFIIQIGHPIKHPPTATRRFDVTVIDSGPDCTSVNIPGPGGGNISIEDYNSLIGVSTDVQGARMGCLYDTCLLTGADMDAFVGVVGPDPVFPSGLHPRCRSGEIEVEAAQEAGRECCGLIGN